MKKIIIPVLLVIGVVCLLLTVNSFKAVHSSSISVHKKMQSQTMHTDVPPDSVEIAFFSALPQPKATDTDFNRFVIPIAGRKVNIRDYIASQQYRGSHGYALIEKNKPSAEIRSLSRLSIKQTTLGDFLTDIIASAKDIAGTIQFKDNAPGDANRPQQTKLSYSWGRKDYKSRYTPCDQCTTKVYGVDCSGFFYQVFLPLHVDFSRYGSDAEDERTKANIEAALKSHFPGMKVIATDHPHSIDFQAGDLIYFYNAKKQKASHIGIVIENDIKDRSFYATTGDSCRNNDGCCLDNLNRGPQIRPLPTKVVDQYKRIIGYVRLSVQ